MAAPAYNAGGFNMPPPQNGQQGVYPDLNQQPHAQQMQPLMNQDQQKGDFGPPVQGQDGQWMAPVQEQQVPLNCPPGLEYLTMIDQLMIKQRLEMLEAAAGALGYNLETANKYKIKNVLGQNVYKAEEDTECCTRIICGPLRPFDMIIKDNADREVIHLNRPYRCNSCCFPCCLQEIEVSSPPGTVIGYVKQKWTCIKPKFEITDGEGNVALVIAGPWCTFSCASDVVFKVMTADESEEVGRIAKNWTGILREAVTDMDNFTVSFPMDLDVRAKATLLGAAFLIDYMYFEKKGSPMSE